MENVLFSGVPILKHIRVYVKHICAQYLLRSERMSERYDLYCTLAQKGHFTPKKLSKSMFIMHKGRTKMHNITMKEVWYVK